MKPYSSKEPNSGRIAQHYSSHTAFAVLHSSGSTAVSFIVHSWPRIVSQLFKTTFARMYQFSLAKSSGPCLSTSDLLICMLIEYVLPFLFSHLSKVYTYFKAQQHHSQFQLWLKLAFYRNCSTLYFYQLYTQ